MWILELELDSEKQFVGKFAIKHNISTASYNLSYYKDKKWIYLIGAGFIFGEEKNKRAFIKDLKKQSFVKEYEFKNDFGVGIVKQPLFTEPFWNRKVIQVNPSLISSKQKKHIWYLASFDRKALEKILNVAEKKLGAKLLKFKQ